MAKKTVATKKKQGKTAEKSNSGQQLTPGQIRLLKLAAFLRTVPEQNFNMGYWWSSAAAELDCGTSGCAGGWACRIPEFRKAGLRPSFVGAPALGSSFGPLASLRRFFEIDAYFDAEHLFGSQFRTPRQEADVIERYVVSRFKKAAA